MAKEQPISIRLFPEQKKKLSEVARAVRLSEQDCFRQALDFGLPILKKAILSGREEAESQAAA